MRPHSSLKNATPVSLDALKEHSLMPDKWVALLEQAAATLKNGLSKIKPVLQNDGYPMLVVIADKQIPRDALDPQKIKRISGYFSALLNYSIVFHIFHFFS